MGHTPQHGPRSPPIEHEHIWCPLVEASPPLLLKVTDQNSQMTQLAPHSPPRR